MKYEKKYEELGFKMTIETSMHESFGYVRKVLFRRKDADGINEWVEFTNANGVRSYKTGNTKGVNELYDLHKDAVIHLVGLRHSEIII